MVGVTENAIQLMFTNESKDTPRPLRAQILEIEKRGRYYAAISDGKSKTKAVLATQLNASVQQNAFPNNCIVEIGEYVKSDTKGTQFLLILNMEFHSQLNSQIGNPVDYDPSKATIMNPNAVVKREGQVGGNPQQAIPMQFHQSDYQNQTQQQQQQQQFGGNNNGQYQNQYGQQQQQQQHQQQQQYMHRSGPTTTPSAHDSNYLPIRGLTPYQDKFTIKARVTSKSEIKTWDKGPTNSGKLFSVHLVDEEGTEIRATFFKEAVDQFHSMIQKDGVYLFSNGRIKMANKKFSGLKNDYEINFGRDVQVEPVRDKGEIAHVIVKPTRINDLDQIDADKQVDIVGVCLSCTDVQEFTSKAGKPMKKAEVEIVDDSQASVRITVWGDEADVIAQKLKNQPNQVVVGKSLKVSDWNGRSLSTSFVSPLVINPDIPEAGKVRAWFDNGGLNNGIRQMSDSVTPTSSGARAAKPISERYTIEATKSLGPAAMANASERGEFVEIFACIQFIKKERMWYAACPEEGNNKKVTFDQTQNKWFCESNGKMYDHPEYRYIMSTKISDHTGSTWVTVFNEVAETILGYSANELQKAQETENPIFDAAIDATNFKTGLMTIRITEEPYEGSSRQKLSLVRFNPIDYVSESNELLRAIQQMQI